MKIIKNPTFVVRKDWWVGQPFMCFKCGAQWSLEHGDDVDIRATGSWREAMSSCPNCDNDTRITNGGTP